MSTNTDNLQGLPSVEALQEIANHLFKSLPDEAPKEISLNPYEHPRATAFAQSVAGSSTPAASIPGDQWFSQTAIPPVAGVYSPVGGYTAPPSSGGLGASSSIANYADAGNPYSSIKNDGSYIPGGYPNPSQGLAVPGGEPFFSQAGVQPAVTAYTPVGGSAAPPSATGLGASSSVANHADISEVYPDLNTDTSTIPSAYPAPNQAFAVPVAGNQPQPPASNNAGQANNVGGNVPVSVAGSGASPSYTHQQDNFSIAEPVTSFPDANIDKGSRKQEPFNPWQDPYLPDIEALLNFGGNGGPSIASTQSFAPAFPDAAPSFYFLKESHQPIQNGQLGGFSPGFDAYKIKRDFPILNEKVNGKPLVWLDNAATTQKPQSVINRISYFYQHENSNIHRAAHELAARATDAYEAARKKVQQFLGARSVNEIVFVRGATEAINLVAQSWGEQYLKSGDEIIVSNLEHHANIVPWKRLADKKGLSLKVIPVDDDGQILLNEYGKLLTSKTKLVAFTQVSNALGTVTPAEQMVAMAHAAGARVLVDGAQSVSHMPVNVQALDADWFVFSGHKVFGPTGIGVVYGKEDLLNSTEPWQGGGNMIQDVTFEHIQYHKAPNRFEAGTGNIADAVGLGAAIDYVTELGMANIGAYEHALLEYATHHLKSVPGVRLIGTAAHKASVLSFTLQGYSNDEVGKALNNEGIAVRTGHHCAQPILRRMGVETTVRPSLAFYNTCEDVDKLVATVASLKRKPNK